VDAGRDLHADDALAQLLPGAATARAVVADDGPAAAAVRAGRDHAEHPAEPLLRDAPLSAALRADGGAGAGLGAGALARIAGVLALELDRLLRAARHLGERELDLRLEVVPARGSRRAAPDATTTPARGATEPAAEDLVEHREDVRHVHVREVVLRVDALVPELVVAAALGFVAEDLVGLGALLELRLRVGLVVPVVAVGVVLHREASVRALDLLLRRGARDAEDLVIISLGRGHRAPFYCTA
jgi:hypothetical protein